MTVSQILSLIWIVLPAVVGISYGIYRGKFRYWIPFLLSTIIGYVLVIGSVQIRESELRQRLREFDLNNDGVFTSSEITSEQREVMRALTNDTGRTFAPFTGIPITAIWAAINLGALGAGFRLVSMGKAWSTKR